MSNDSPNEPEEQSGGPVVTALTPISEQVGRNVLKALNDEEAVAVVTTLVAGINGDRVVSLGLSASQMAQVGALLEEINAESEDVEEESCIGFQCRLPRE